MLRTRIILFVVCALAIWGLFLLPKAVVENDSQLAAAATEDSVASTGSNPHNSISPELLKRISLVRAGITGSANKKNAIFADSLAALYRQAGKFDSAAWYAGRAATFFNTTESFLRAADLYYEAFTFAVTREKQQALADTARLYFTKVLNVQPRNLDVKTRMAMTYVGSSTPMAGIQMLRDVLAEDPKNQPALFNMGMLAIQSGQYDRAIERLTGLIAINPAHVQAHLLLGVALMNKGDKQKAREEFETVKKLDSDPSVQATADSYLKDLK